MKLKSMIRSHDDSALEALASKGLLRRAHRDLELGLGRIETVSEDQAEISVDEQSVVVVETGPHASSCTCKAQGVCRHILLAVLLLRNQSAAPTETEDEPEPSSATNEVCSLSQEQVAKFAGADWNKAIGLANDNLAVAFDEQGASITVSMAELNAAVTFIAGAGLRGAAFKGTKTRKRLLVAVATLAVRRREGLSTPDDSQLSASSPNVGAEFILEAQRTIEQAVSATLPSRSALAHDLFLDLAISSRCEALPRLSAELRALAGQSQLASKRSAEFEPAAFLMDASRSYALLEVLRTNPTDPILAGSVRRTYENAEAIEVWLLGASRWRTKTGARGLSAYVLEPSTGRWLTVIEGRGAGIDYTFDVASAYEMPKWGAGTLSSLMGRQVWLPEPSITIDGLLSGKNQNGSRVSKNPLKPDEILQSVALHSNWDALREDLTSRMGSGIRRRSTPIPAMLAPSSSGQIGFDDMSQSYNWEIHDEVGDSLILKIPGEDDVSAIRLWKLGKRIVAMMVEARLDVQGLEIRPVSIVQRSGSSISVHNVDFDKWPVERGIKKVLSKFSESVAKPLVTSQTDINPISQVVSEAVEKLVHIVSGPTAENYLSVQRKLEASGLATLAGGLQRVSGPEDLRSVLLAAYVASELESLLVLDSAANNF